MPDTSVQTARAFWVTGPGKSEIREAPVGPGGDSCANMVEVQTLYSAISRGTESLVFRNRVPESEYDRMRAPFQVGEFPYPVCYGYANVGRVVSGPDHLRGRMVFCLFPHQTRYRVPVDAVIPVPPGVPVERAILAANMETAINGLWDADPRLGDKVAVVGCGVVGALMAYLANRIPGVQVTAIDKDPDRRALLEGLGTGFATATADDDFDLVIHASGHPEGLRVALSLAGQEARIVEMSWFGDREASLPLGRGFHVRRLTLRSSQVGGINPSQLPRWNYRRRLALALSLLDDPALDALISGESRFEELPATMARVSQGGNGELCHRVVYSPDDDS
ncbi:MAG: zinc-binding alcohol dehydrogenase [Oleiphilaceae bacterium]|nr:zinc-binding alcohol dehydrogenase [Oleiphilaceae bacterium]